VKEKWKPVPGHERYFVSQCGRVWDTWRKKLMSFTETEKGYLTVQLNTWDGKSRKLWKVHRIVMVTFENYNVLPIDHKDTDKKNNHIWNLEYVTHKENMRRRLATPTQSSRHPCHLCSV
jgi:hypothetical protein